MSDLYEEPIRKVSYLGYCLYGPSGHPLLDTFHPHAWAIKREGRPERAGYTIQPVKITIEVKR